MGQLEDHDRIQEEYRLAMLQSNHPAMTPAEYRGLYGEVVTEDVYGLRSLDFAPDVIFDVGACIGIFSRFARQLFPDAQIIAVEPDPQNFHNLQLLTPDSSGIELREMALGNGPVWHCRSDGNGANQCYLSSAPGFPRELAELNPQYVLSTVPTVCLADLLGPWQGKMKVLKLDCEGGENALYCHGPSLQMLQTVEYIAMELHGPVAVTPAEISAGALSAGQDQEMRKGIVSILEALSQTHTVVYHHPILHARKHHGTAQSA